MPTAPEPRPRRCLVPVVFMPLPAVDVEIPSGACAAVDQAEATVAEKDY